MVYLFELAGYFFAWTLILYWTHRAAHRLEFLWRFHSAHHETHYDGSFEFSWWNLIGWFNDWRSTLDQWIVEIIPTAIFIAVFPAAWPLAVLYFVDNALAEGITDHNPRIRVPGLAMGRYHLVHHEDHGANLDVYTPFWDRVFGTYRHVV